MTTLIAVYDSSGHLVGRCDAKCYNAEHPQCDCICGGRNHGVGLNRALDNTREWLLEELRTNGMEDTATTLQRLFETYKAQMGLDASAHYEVNAEAVLQLALPLGV